MCNNELEKFEDFARLMQRDLSFTQVQMLLIRYRNDGDFKALEELICACLWSTTVLAITVCENNGTTPTIDHVAEAINAFRLAADNCSVEEDFIEHAQKAIVNALDKKHNTEKQDFSGYAVHIRERTLSYIKQYKKEHNVTPTKSELLALWDIEKNCCETDRGRMRRKCILDILRNLPND